jgi:hypothetical protein
MPCILISVLNARRRKMQSVGRVSGTVILFTTVAFVVAPNTSAQAKKLTYEQAFAACKAEISKNVSPSEGSSTAARHAAGGACMKRHGYRLKKSTMM